LVQYKDPQAEGKEKLSSWQTYENPKYGYRVRYPADWHIFSDEAESDFSERELSENQKAKQGGAVFWSNRDSLDYTDENRPADFRLLGLVLYEKPDSDISDLAKRLGFTEGTGASDLIFKAKSLAGKEYVSFGIDDNQPRSAVIFKNGDRFFVFHFGFVGTDQESLKKMEEVAGSLEIR
jgi:hypothetical protein